jgi:redox-sensitive bicupin YhaK (pirin superfamily)
VTQEIRPSEVNWMVAGRGITHSERFDHAREHGALMHGIQAWVALPAELEEADPAFYHHEGSAELPTWVERGVRGRLIAGSAEGMQSAVKVQSPQFYMHCDMDAGASRNLPAEYPERAIYVAAGAVEVAGRMLRTGQMAVLERGNEMLVSAMEATTIMVLGGEPIGERLIYWNFVSSSKERLAQAAADWKAGRMKLPDADDAEFIPLPDEPAPPAPAMS